MRRLGKLVGWLAGILVVLAMAITLAALWLYTSESGARFALARIAALTDGALVIEGVEGRVNDELRLSGIRYRDELQELDIDELRLRLGLYRILAGELSIESLRVSAATYRSLQSGEDESDADAESPGTPDSESFSLPIAIRLVRSSVSELTIIQGDQTLEVQRLVMAGVASDSQALLQRFEFTVLDFFVSVQGVTDWSDGLAVDGLASWSGEFDDRPWLGSIEVVGQWPVLAIEQELIQPFEQTARGNVLIGETPAFDLLFEAPVLGEFTLVGGLDPDSGYWRARGSGAFNGESLEADVSVARREDGLIDIEQLSARYGENRALLAGSASETIDLVLDFEFSELASIAALGEQDPFRSFVSEDWPLESLAGEAAGRVAVSGPLDQLDIDTDIVLGGSELAGLPLDAELAFAGSVATGGDIELEDVVVTLGGTRLEAAGTVSVAVPPGGGFDLAGTGFDLDIALISEDLAEINAIVADDVISAWLPADLALEPLGGSLQTQFALGGDVSAPQLSGVLGGESLAWGDFTLETVEVEISLQARDGGSSSIRLSARNERGAVQLSARGRLDQSVFSGTVEELVLTEPLFGSWALAGAAPFVVGEDRIEIDNACIENLGSQFCGEWQRSPQSESIALHTEGFELAVLNGFLPPELSLNGRIDLDATLDSPTGTPSGQLVLRGDAIDVGMAMSETDQFTTRLASVNVEAALENYGLAVDATVESARQGSAVISMTSADIRNDDSDITGRLAIDWPDLAVLSLLSPDVGEVNGRLGVAVDVAGTVQSPEVSGEVSLSDGSVSIPEWGIAVERINGEANSPGGQVLNFSGSGFVEDSELVVSGETVLDLAAGWPTQFSLSGDRVAIARRPDATVLASPDFDVVIELPRIEVSGMVEIPSAQISVEELPAQAVRVSSDSVVHGVEETAAERPLDVTADVTVSLGSDVSYSGAGLMADLGGQFRLEYESGLSPIANGVLGIAGTYEAYGQSLTLERGELLFSGPLDDPALDVLAVREIGTIQAGIRLSGTLLEPTSSLYSDPPMSELDALSYLITGRPYSSAGEFDDNALQSTALALGVRQALPAIQRVGESLGLDELAIEANDLDAGALMAGKYLSPRLYMSYSYGLFNRLGGFLLRYEISDSLSLETRSGSEKAMDLLYSIEKD